VFFAGDSGYQRRRRKGKGEEAEQTRSLPSFCGGARTHAPPVAVARGKTRRHEFLQFLKHYLCNSWSFEDCFVKFELFDVIFIYF